MKALKGTLTFVLGMILGVILLFVAIAGTIVGIATSVTVGELQQKVGMTGDSAIIDEGSNAADMSLWELGKSAIEDFGNFSSMTLNELAEKYGLTGKLDSLACIVDGIDFSPIFDVPISEIGSSVHLIVENITLNDIGTLAGLDFSSYDIPVIQENLYNSVTKALDEILSGIDGENMTLRQIEDNFGLTLGESAIFEQIKDAPLSSFSSIINGLEVGTIIDADCDLFVLNGSNPVYVQVNRYEQVSADEINYVKDGAKTYISDADDDGNLIYKELRYTVKTTIDEEGNEITSSDETGAPIYKVDNSCYASDEENDKTYYRFVEYEKATASNVKDGAKLFVRTYANHFEKDESGNYSPIQSGFVALDTLTISATAGANVVITSADKYLDGESLVNMEVYGIAAEEYPSADTRLIAGGNESYLLVHKGSSDTAIQAIAYTTVKGLNNATDSLMGLRLGDLIDVTEDSPAILKTLKDTALNELSNSIDTLTLGDVIEITYSSYVIDNNGIYVYVSAQADYKVVGSDFTGTCYVANFSENADGKYVQIDGVYYLYDKDNADMEGRTRYEKTFAIATATEIANSNIVKYERVDNGGYYTLYNPDEHDGMQRYSKLTDKTDSDAPDYIVATDEQIADGSVVKYYWNGSAMQTSKIAGGVAYVKGTASSKVLQRLASISIGDFSDSFSDLVLGDVLDIEMDVYVAATAPFVETKDYYYFEDGAYKIADVFDTAFMAEHADTVFYEVVIAGESNAVLKKLAFTKIDDMAAKMDVIIDDMRLNEVIDITVDLYMPDNDGKYVYVANGGYYTLYNPAIHGDSATRYSKITGTKTADEGQVEFSYVVATGTQIANDSVVKYYWNDSEKQMQTSAIAGATAYVEGNVSSSTLQRFAKVKIGNFSSAFDEVILADVIEIDGDVYETANAIADFVSAADTTDENKAYYIVTAGNYEPTTRTYIESNPDEDYYEFIGGKYYYYSDGVYLEATPEFIGSHVTEQYYEMTAVGTTHAVLRKMAYLPVNDLGKKMETVINDMYLKDLIGINEYDEVKSSDVSDGDENARWLIDKDDNYTEIINGETYYYTFAYDINGKYYLRADAYVKLTAEQLAKFEYGTIYYGYTAFTSTDIVSFGIEAAAHPYMYYCADASVEDATYSLNPALTAYLATKGTFNKIYYRDVTASASNYEGKTYKQSYYNGNPLLYVNFSGAYVPYDASNPAHCDMDIYIYLQDGYCLNQNGEYLFDTNACEFTTTANDYTIDLAFAKLPQKNFYGNIYYYFAKLDADYNTMKEAGYSIVTFSKQVCDEVFLADGDGEYTNFDGDYVLKSALPDGAQGEGSFTLRIAYVATVGENCLVNATSAYVDHISTDKVEIVKAKSAHVIKAFATHDVKVGNLDDAMKTFTLEDLMEVEPDSLFDDAAIRATTLDSLGDVFQTKLQEMTINDILDWGNITTLKPEVLSIIGDVRLEQFFAALEYNSATGITVNLEKLFA